VLIYDSVLSEEQLQANERYLNYKWFGVVSSGLFDPILPTTTAVVLSNGGILDIGGVHQTIGSLSSIDSSGTQVQLGNGTLTVGHAASTSFDGVISGSGGLVKQGSGTLTLSGAMTYTGNTTVNGGTLKLGNGSSPSDLADNADLILTPGAMLGLNFAGTDVIDELWLDGNRMPVGVYSAASGFITGTGTLTVTNGPTSGNYIVWSGRGGYELSGTPADDDDSDGIPNLLEYVLGGNPEQKSSGLLPTATRQAGNLVFTFRRVSSSTTDTTQTFQYSSDMQTWSDVPITASGMVSILADTPLSGTDTVTITIPEGVRLRLFGRLHVRMP
jgi:autotransporter-associated beta strand protein